MDEHIQWTEDLGEAFLAQEADVMDSVQQLRSRAYASGHLRSTPQIRVIQEGPLFYLRPVQPEFVYVPYYDPLVVYGDWRWPGYRPVVWAPWPGYRRPASVGFWFGSGVSLSANFFFGDFDWGRRTVRVVRPTAYYYRPPRVVVNNTYFARSGTVDRSSWQHDPHHRRTADYRQPEVRQRFATAPVERRDVQRDERGTDRRGERREAQAPTLRQAQPPQAQPQFRAQERQEQTRPERREARDAQQRSEADRTQRDQQRQQAEAARAQQQAQRQQAEQAQRQQAEQARAQQQAQRQQAEQARAQQQAQRQQAEQARAHAGAGSSRLARTAGAAPAGRAGRAQQQAQRQQAREERRAQREERKEHHADRGDKGG
jgi:hypothetical protein